MRKRGHLTLVHTAPNLLDQEMLVQQLSITNFSAEEEGGRGKTKSFARAATRESKRSEIEEIEKEVKAMLDVVNASFLLLNAIPAHEMSLHDLKNLKEMFEEGQIVVAGYKVPVMALSRQQLSPTDLRRVKRISADLSYLENRLPDAIEIIEAGRQLIQEKAKSGSKAKGSSRSSKFNKLSAVEAQAPNGLQLKVTLEGSKPPIWRRIEVPGDASLKEMHQAIQYFMGWRDEHQYCFMIDGKEHRVKANSKKSATLAELKVGVGSKFSYEYDFGDSWLHQIVVEKELSEPIDEFACTGGKRACPPEDCGGIASYRRMLAILKDPEHPAHEDVKFRLGRNFDPERY